MIAKKIVKCVCRKWVGPVFFSHFCRKKNPTPIIAENSVEVDSK